MNCLALAALFDGADDFLKPGPNFRGQVQGVHRFKRLIQERKNVFDSDWRAASILSG